MSGYFVTLSCFAMGKTTTIIVSTDFILVKVFIVQLGGIVKDCEPRLHLIGTWLGLQSSPKESYYTKQPGRKCF